MLRLNYNVTEFVVVKAVVVARLECKHREDDKNNIYGIINGRVAWRVQDMLEYDPDLKLFMPNSYTYIEKYDKDAGLILATTFQGFRFLINPHNWRIIGTESWVK